MAWQYLTSHTHTRTHTDYLSSPLPSQDQPKIIEPLDYEAVVFQRKAQIHSDPHRDLLLCPVDDVSVSRALQSSISYTVMSSQGEVLNIYQEDSEN